MSALVYLDYNCFQRGFDDQSQTRIRMQTAACEEIFEMAVRGRIRLAWSFMHEDENALSPFVDRKIEVLKLSELCRVRIPPAEPIRLLALAIEKQYRLTGKDALHVACARHSGANCFVTCDEAVRKRTGGRVEDMVVVRPTEYVVTE